MPVSRKLRRSTFGKAISGIGKNIARYARKQIRSGAVTRGLEQAGGMYGGDYGSMTGRALGRAITGHGDYHVRGRGFSHRRRYRRRDGGRMGHSRVRGHLEKGEMVITHSEYIGELITGSAAISAFTSQTYGINAGNAGLFPWLSGVADNFQEYQFDKLVFEYKALAAESAGASTVVPMGSVQIATQYDSMLPSFANKAQMENSDFAVSAKPSKSLLHAIECKPSLNVLGRYYVASNSNPTGSGQTNNDIRFQNMGYIQAASVNVPTGGSAIDLGELWIHYTCRLFKPTIVGQFNNINSSHYTFASPTPANPFGAASAQTAAATNNLSLTYGVNISGASANIQTEFYFPLAVTQGAYLVCYYLTNFSGGGSFNQPTLAPTSSNGTCTFYSLMPKPNLNTGDQAAFAIGPGASTSTAFTTSTSMLYMFVCLVNAPGSSLGTITFQNPGGTNLFSTTTGSFGEGNLYVTPWAANMTV